MHFWLFSLVHVPSTNMEEKGFMYISLPKGLGDIETVETHVTGDFILFWHSIFKPDLVSPFAAWVMSHILSNVVSSNCDDLRIIGHLQQPRQDPIEDGQTKGEAFKWWGLSASKEKMMCFENYTILGCSPAKASLKKDKWMGLISWDALSLESWWKYKCTDCSVNQG